MLFLKIDIRYFKLGFHNLHSLDLTLTDFDDFVAAAEIRKKNGHIIFSFSRYIQNGLSLCFVSRPFE